MKLSDSLVFAALGTAMEILPRIFPASFPHTAGDSANARALWLQFMGAVQIALGASVILVLKVAPLARALLAAAAPGHAEIPVGAKVDAIRR